MGGYLAMRPLLWATLVLLAPINRGDVSWSPGLRTALSWAKRTKQPVVVACQGSRRGPGFLMDPEFDRTFSTAIPVEVPTYNDVLLLNPDFPRTGDPSLVVLDSSGRLLKRLSGMIRPADIEIAVVMGSWAIQKGDDVLGRATGGKGDGNTYADGAIVLALRGDVDRAARFANEAVRRKASPGRLYKAWSALADEERVDMLMQQAVNHYGKALALRPPGSEEVRIRLRLATTLNRIGQYQAATEHLQRVVASHVASKGDVMAANRMLSRGAGFMGYPPMGVPPPPRGR